MHKFTIFSGLILFVLSGCERAGPLEGPDPSDEVTLTQIQTNIFDTNCALSGCHTGGNPPQGLDLSVGQAFSNLVNVASMEQSSVLRVAPGDPENSYLLHKIRGDAGITGSQMPLGRTALSASEIELVRQWIEDGAQNN